MKFISFFVFLIIITSSLSEAQPKHKRLFGPPDKIRELEKIKLIEILDMDEETTLKFFARRNEHLKKMEELNKSCDDELSQIEEKIKTSNNENDPEFTRLVNDYLVEQDKFNSERKDFLSSVKDILTPEQLAKLVVFERRFKEEIRNIIYREKRRK
jgi:gas vesicle protein